MNDVLFPVRVEEEILPKWRGTPIADLLAYHNLGRPHGAYDKAELLVAMCMDYRKALRIPDRFAYVLRNGGGNPGRVEFEISFAIAVGGVKALALIAHDDCGMVGLSSRRDAFVQGLVQHGWKHEEAEIHYDLHAPLHEVTDELEFVRTEAHRMQRQYPNIAVAPLFYSVEDGLLYQIREFAISPAIEKSLTLKPQEQ